jgi:hypothetical protein
MSKSVPCELVAKYFPYDPDPGTGNVWHVPLIVVVTII